MMASVNFVAYALTTLGSIVLIFGIMALSVFISHRIRNKCWQSEDTCELIVGIISVSAGIALYHISPDENTRIQMFFNMKPKCHEETIECLSKKAEWYKDSAEYKVVRPFTYKDETKTIDSLKNEIKKYKK